MAWNIPGKNDDGGSGKDRRNPWKPRRGNGGGLGGLFDNFRGMFDGGGGSPLRWVGLALVLWLAFNYFVLVAEQERGVVLRFGQYRGSSSPARTSSCRGRSSACTRSHHTRPRTSA